MRNKKQEEKEDEIHKMRDIKSIDDFISDDLNAAVIPAKLAMRMGNRMLPFVVILLFGVMLTFLPIYFIHFLVVSFLVNITITMIIYAHFFAYTFYSFFNFFSY